jgi:ribosomal-protein-alanine N-acetyltransferase
MPEARRRIISFYFDKHPDFVRMHSEVATNNRPSLKMNEKLGFKLEGVLRHYEKSGTAYQDIAVLSLLRSDYLQHPAYAEYRVRS